MSKITLAVLCITIAGIVTGMVLELPQLAGPVGPLLIMAIAYSFIVARRELGLILLAVREQREEETDRRAARLQHRAAHKRTL